LPNGFNNESVIGVLLVPLPITNAMLLCVGVGIVIVVGILGEFAVDHFFLNSCGPYAVL
jgi:hypothetical protein